jgi:hypothetical protein
MHQSPGFQSNKSTALIKSPLNEIRRRPCVLDEGIRNTRHGKQSAGSPQQRIRWTAPQVTPSVCLLYIYPLFGRIGSKAPGSKTGHAKMTPWEESRVLNWQVTISKITMQESISY